jgi:arginine:agmatine antiporter
MAAGGAVAGGPANSRKLGPVLAALVVAGNIIGAGIFALPAEIGAVGGVGLIGWVIATIGAFAVGAVLSILANLTGDPDGMVGYVSRTMSPFWGFLAGVVYWFSNFTAIISLAVACAGYLSVYFPLLTGPLARSLTSLAALWLATGINLVGAKAVGRFSAVFLLAGLAPLLLLATVGWGHFRPEVFAGSWNVSGKSDLQGVQASVLAAFWAFTGLETGAMISAVVRNPRRDVPIATLGGVGLAAAVYLSVLVVILGLAPAKVYATSGAPLALAVSRIGGTGWAGMVAAFALIKIMGTLSGMTLATAEAARATLAARPFARPRVGRPADGARRSETPTGILLWTAAAAGLVALATTSPSFVAQFGALVDLSAIWTLIPYLMCALALGLIARRYRGRARWGLAGVVLVASVVTACVILTATPLSYAFTVALAAAIVGYWVLATRRGRRAA